MPFVPTWSRKIVDKLPNFGYTGNNMEWLVALYCRSDPETESTLDGVTIREQGWHAVSFLEREKHADWKISEIYEDRKASGLDPNREGLNRLLNDARHHRFHIVLVMIPQVLSLSTVHYYEIVCKLEKWHISFFTMY